MHTATLQRAAVLTLVVTMTAACAKTSENPFRQSSAYSALPYLDDNTVHVLADGELHYSR